jgi:hypothetical protein
MKLLKDFKRTLDLFKLYLTAGFDDILHKIYEFRFKKVPKKAQKVQKKWVKVGKSGAKCRKCTCSTEKNKKNI